MFAWVENPIVGTQVITWGASTALEFKTCDDIITADTVSQQHRKSILMWEGGGSQHECWKKHVV